LGFCSQALLPIFTPTTPPPLNNCALPQAPIPICECQLPCAHWLRRYKAAAIRTGCTPHRHSSRLVSAGAHTFTHTPGGKPVPPTLDLLQALLSRVVCTLIPAAHKSDHPSITPPTPTAVGPMLAISPLSPSFTPSPPQSLPWLCTWGACGSRSCRASNSNCCSVAAAAAALTAAPDSSLELLAAAPAAVLAPKQQHVQPQLQCWPSSSSICSLSCRAVAAAAAAAALAATPTLRSSRLGQPQQQQQPRTLGGSHPVPPCPGQRWTQLRRCLPAGGPSGRPRSGCRWGSWST
jgi:hypothetical protein